MTPMTKTIFATVGAAAAVVSQAAAADSLVRVHASGPLSLESVLRPLPNDMPWLNMNRRPAPKKPLLGPDAGTARAWMFTPTPTEGHSPVLIQSAGAPPSVAGM